MLTVLLIASKMEWHRSYTSFMFLGVVFNSFHLFSMCWSARKSTARIRIRQSVLAFMECKPLQFWRPRVWNMWHTRGDNGSDEWETLAKVILGWSNEHNHLSNKSVHNIQSVRYYPHKKFYEMKPNLCNVKIFGSISFVQTLDEKH